MREEKITIENAKKEKNIKKKRREASRRYYERHKEMHQLRMKVLYLENQGKICSKALDYYYKNREKILKRLRLRRKKLLRDNDRLKLNKKKSQKADRKSIKWASKIFN